MQFFFSLIKTFGKGGCETCIMLKKDAFLLPHVQVLLAHSTFRMLFVLNKDLLDYNFFQFQESQEKKHVRKIFFPFWSNSMDCMFFFASVVTGEAYLSVL